MGQAYSAGDGYSTPLFGFGEGLRYGNMVPEYWYMELLATVRGPCIMVVSLLSLAF